MFPFFEPNLFPLLEGGRLIFYIFLRKGKALLWAFAVCCRGFLPAGSPCIAASLLCYLRICNRCTVSGCVANKILKNVRGNLTPILQDKICR